MNGQLRDLIADCDAGDGQGLVGRSIYGEGEGEAETEEDNGLGFFGLRT